eukprot:584163_1
MPWLKLYFTEPQVLHYIFRWNNGHENTLRTNEAQHLFLECLQAGAVASVWLNPMSVIRFQCWLNHTSFQKEVSNLWHGRGIKNFHKGLTATLLRDVVFGGVFAFLRHWNAFGYMDHTDYKYKQEFMWNAMAALVATTASSPFNYIRNMQFATPFNEKPLLISELLRDIINGYKGCIGLKQKFEYIQIRFKFGWGTLRVGLSLALGSQIYEYLVHTLNDDADELIEKSDI